MEGMAHLPPRLGEISDPTVLELFSSILLKVNGDAEAPYYYYYYDGYSKSLPIVLPLAIIIQKGISQFN